MTLVAVTGVTGQVGRLVASDLQQDAADLRLVVRDRTRLPPGIDGEVVAASYGDGPSARRALQGVDLLFMVSGAESVDRLAQHRTFVEAAAEAGVRHVVYTSFLGASPDATFTLARDHWHTEQYLRSSGMAWTFLRDSLYLDLLPAFAGEDGVIRGPADDGRFGGVARADVARVATTVLREPEAHAGATYDLTGPEAITLDEAAATITRVTGREYRFENETLEGAYASRAVYGAPQWQLDAWVSTYVAIARGELAAVTDTVERLTGRRPLSLADVLAELPEGRR
ncbi:MAG TPA: SDR family oxidoreductase [Propionibacteriaceae bacterium]|nr:SDR family oxidoreductase [Propionibacteriaceae bacterium]